jgi:hypothetical protein
MSDIRMGRVEVSESLLLELLFPDVASQLKLRWEAHVRWWHDRVRHSERREERR